MAKAMYLDEIIIPRDFAQTKPRSEKIAARYEYFRENHRFNGKVVVDENNVLRDGYTIYLVAKMLGLAWVWVEMRMRISKKDKVNYGPRILL